MSLRPLFVLVRKDLQLFFHDRRAVILSFGVPLVLASFFAIVFGGAAGGESQGGARLTVWIADEDGSDLSRRIVASMNEDESLFLMQGTAEEVRDEVRRGKASAAVLIPPGFGSSAPRAMFAAGPKPQLTLFQDPTRAAESAMARGLLTRHVMEALAASAGIRRPSMPFETKEESVAAGDREARVVATSHAFGGMAVQFLLFASIESGIGLLAERQRGLWRRLRAAPIARGMLLLGRGLSAATIALMILAVIFLFGAIAFRLRVTGSVLGFGLVCLSYATTAASFGLLIAALGKTPQAARGLSAMAVLLMVMLGGAWVPTFAFPGWLQKITPLLPTRWAVDGFDATLARGFTLAETMPMVLALVGFTVVFSIAAAARFRWEE
jgi:ABC-2 type transport system permease protein